MLLASTELRRTNNYCQLRIAVLNAFTEPKFFFNILYLQVMDTIYNNSYKLLDLSSSGIGKLIDINGKWTYIIENKKKVQFSKH